MNKLFENTTIYTEDLYSNFLIFHSKKYNFRYNLYTCFISFLLTFCMVLQFSDGQIDMGFIFALVLFIFVFWRVFRPYFIVKKEVNSNKIQEKLKNIYSFYDNYLEVKNSTGVIKIKYSKLYRCFQDNSCFYLYISKDDAFVVSKNGFSLGDPNNFYSFIKRKMRNKLY